MHLRNEQLLPTFFPFTFFFRSFSNSLSETLCFVFAARREKNQSLQISYRHCDSFVQRFFPSYIFHSRNGWKKMCFSKILKFLWSIQFFLHWIRLEWGNNVYWYNRKFNNVELIKMRAKNGSGKFIKAITIQKNIRKDVEWIKDVLKWCVVVNQKRRYRGRWDLIIFTGAIQWRKWNLVSFYNVAVDNIPLRCYMELKEKVMAKGQFLLCSASIEKKCIESNVMCTMAYMT